MKHFEKPRINEFFEDFGKPFAATSVTEEILTKYRNILPERLLQYWEQYGFCGFADGLFWLTNPDDYEHILKTWLPPQVQSQHEHFVIARSGFGRLFVWEPTYGHKFSIDMNFGFIFYGRDKSSWIKNNDEDAALDFFLLMQEKEYLDITDDNDKLLFKRCVKKLGSLASNEIFGFVPAVAINDSMDIKNIKKMDLFVQYDLLRNLIEPRIIDDEELFDFK